MKKKIKFTKYDFVMLVGILLMVFSIYLIFYESSEAKEFCSKNNATLSKNIFSYNYYCDGERILKTSEGWIYKSDFIEDMNNISVDLSNLSSLMPD